MGQDRWALLRAVCCAAFTLCAAACADDGSALGALASEGGGPGTRGPASAGASNESAGGSGSAGVSFGAHAKYAVRHCASEIAERAQATTETPCTSSGDAAFGLLIRGDILGQAEVLRGGELAVDTAGIIACSDCSCAHDPRALIIDCAASVISPGLINLHDHLNYANNAPPANASVERYDDRGEWRLGVRGHAKLAYESTENGALISAQEFRMLLSGVTSMVGGGGRPGLVRNLDVSGLSEGLWGGRIDSDTFPLADASAQGLRTDCAYGKARSTQARVAAAGAYLPHLAEGIDDSSQNELRCSETGSYELLGPTSAVVHAIAVGAPEAQALADSKSWVVWSPRSNLSLYGNTTPVTLLSELGVGLALGTDWLKSGSMNLSRELSCARSLSNTAFNGIFSDFDLFRMVTSNPARALGLGRGLGTLRAGYIADIAIFAEQGLADYSAVVQTQPAALELVLRGGRALYGDSNLIAAFGARNCEELAVCGSTKAACLLADTGLSLAALRRAGEAIYPLFSCAEPQAEPSCVPMRPGQYAPQSLIDDRDGDGVSDATDLCPEIFDPIRPLDHALQADADSDGLGDACDPCPLGPDSCHVSAGLDRDEDGIGDALDNCPDSANPDQADRDADGQGDVCDPCPAANVGLSPCPVSIAQLSDPSAPRIPLGTAVVLRSVHVTAVRPPTSSAQGFFVEDDAGLPHSSLSVYSAAVTLGVRVGQRLTVRGYLSEFDQAPELIEPAIELESEAL